MRFRERTNEDPSEDSNDGPPNGSANSGNLEQMRQVGESLYRAADEAISRALSGDSLQFLQQTHQMGGQ